MAQKSNNPFKFWQELKRRKVFRVLATYAGAAYIIIELVNNIAEPLHFPGWISTAVILFLITAFPVIAVLSWIFDLTPEGLKKTRSIEESEQPESKTVKKKFKIHDLVIIVLVIIVIILLYPRVFKTNVGIRSITYPVSIVNEYGDKERLKVFKESYVSTIMIFLFDTDQPDTNNSWLRFGIPYGVDTDLKQFPYLRSYTGYNMLRDQERINMAKNYKCPYYLTGSYSITDGNYSITARLYNTSSGLILNEKTFVSKEFFNIIDSISRNIRKELKIPEYIMEEYQDLAFKEFETHDLDAYRYKISGTFLPDASYSENLVKAIEQDSTYGMASIYLALNTIMDGKSNISAKKYINHTMRHKQRWPKRFEMQVALWYYFIYEDKVKAVEMCENLRKSFPNSTSIYEHIFEIYSNYSLYSEALRIVKKLNKMDPFNPYVQAGLLDSYLLTKRYRKGLRTVNEFLEENPSDRTFLLQKILFHILTDELDKVDNIIHQAALIKPEEQDYWDEIQDQVNLTEEYNNINNRKDFTGRYRSDYDERYDEISILNDRLFIKLGEYPGGYGYLFLTSDTTAFTVVRYAPIIIPYKFKSRDDGSIIYYLDPISPENYDAVCWKQDSLIVRVEGLVKNESYDEALPLLKKLYKEKPEHYYLLNYIRHIEFIENEQEEDSQFTSMEIFTGEYDYYEIFLENGKLYLKDSRNAYIYLLLPVSEKQFISPSFYYKQILFEEQNDSLTGFNFIFNHGGKEFIERKGSH